MGESLMPLSCRSSVALTVVPSEYELFAGVGSAWSAVTLALSVFVPPAPGVTTMLALKVLKAGRLDQLQVTVPLLRLHEPEPVALELT